MRDARRLLVTGIATAVLVVAGAVPALAHGPQDLPVAACNHGTATAHSSLGANAQGGDHIPHSHLSRGLLCVHVNPTANH